MAKFGTNVSGAIWWPNLELMQVAPSGGQSGIVLSLNLHQAESHQLSFKKVCEFVCLLQRTGPIDRTPGTPGSDKKGRL